MKYNPRTYTLSAMILGYIMIGSYSAYEQNAIGNWFMTIGQILECNSAIQQTIEDKFQGNSYNINSKHFKQTKDPYMHNKALIDALSDEDLNINHIKNVLNKLIEELNKIKPNK